MLGKKIKPINKQYVGLKSAFQEERTRLLQLNSDIANGFGKRQKYDQYIQTETKNVSLLIQRSNELKQEIHDIIQDPVTYWLPYIVIHKIEVITSEEDPTLPYQTKISILYSVGRFSTETITIFAI